MMNCIFCEKSIPEDGLFCPYCGKEQLAGSRYICTLTSTPPAPKGLGGPAAAVVRLTASGDYAAAYALLGKLLQQPKAVEPLPEPNAPRERKARLPADAQVGDCIFFGAYPQSADADAKEPIEWLVLAKDGNKVLVISKYALNCKPYNARNVEITWKTCSLRQWLNIDFYNMAFSDSEIERIQRVVMETDKTETNGTGTGDCSADNVFLLSIAEANRYFPDDEARKCAPTEYAIAQGTGTLDGHTTSDKKLTCWWWLRSLGIYFTPTAAGVNYDGSVDFGGGSIDSIIVGVRPAMWIRLDDENRSDLSP